MPSLLITLLLSIVLVQSNDKLANSLTFLSIGNFKEHFKCDLS